MQAHPSTQNQSAPRVTSRATILTTLLAIAVLFACKAPVAFETTVAVEPVAAGWSGADVRVLGTRPAGVDVATDYAVHLVLRVRPNSSHELNASAIGGIMRIDEPGIEALQPGTTLDVTSMTKFMVGAGVAADSPTLSQEAAGLILVLESAGMGPKAGVRSNDYIRIVSQASHYR